MTYRQDIGRRGEDIACLLLAESGFVILERNFRTKFGELDIVALREKTEYEPPITVFVEVKTRTSSVFGTPEEAFDCRKRLRFERAALCYLADHSEVRDWRIDFIGITLDRSGRMIYREHVRDVESSK